MNSVAEFSVERGSSILREAMESRGYPGDVAIRAVWAALWLERLGLGGVGLLVVYLLLVRKEPFEALKPREDADFGVTALCPFMLGALVARNVAENPGQALVSVRGPAAPLLMAPELAQAVENRGLGVRVRFGEAQISLSAQGFEFESPNIGAILMLDDKAQEPTQFEFVEMGEDLMRPLRDELETIALPARRLRDGKLWLGD